MIVAERRAASPGGPARAMGTASQWPGLSVGASRAMSAGAPDERPLPQAAEDRLANFDIGSIRPAGARPPPRQRGAGGQARLWAAAIALSLAVHAGALVATLVWPASNTPTAADAIPVEIVVREAAPDAAPTVSAAPQPAPAEAAHPTAPPEPSAPSAEPPSAAVVPPPAPPWPAQPDLALPEPKATISPPTSSPPDEPPPAPQPTEPAATISPPASAPPVESPPTPVEATPRPQAAPQTLKQPIATPPSPAPPPPATSQPLPQTAPLQPRARQSPKPRAEPPRAAQAKSPATALGEFETEQAAGRCAQAGGGSRLQRRCRRLSGCGVGAAVGGQALSGSRAPARPAWRRDRQFLDRRDGPGCGNFAQPVGGRRRPRRRGDRHRAPREPLSAAARWRPAHVLGAAQLQSPIASAGFFPRQLRESLPSPAHLARLAAPQRDRPRPTAGLFRLRREPC